MARHQAVESGTEVPILKQPTGPFVVHEGYGTLILSCISGY